MASAHIISPPPQPQTTTPPSSIKHQAFVALAHRGSCPELPPTSHTLFSLPFLVSHPSVSLFRVASRRPRPSPPLSSVRRSRRLSRPHSIHRRFFSCARVAKGRPTAASVTYLGRGVEILVQGTWSLSLVTYSFHPSPASITHTSVEVPFRCPYERPHEPACLNQFFFLLRISTTIHDRRRRTIYIPLCDIYNFELL